MAKRRGYPDRRGMGAQSDFLAESFVPDERQTAELITRAKTLIGLGLPLERVATMLSLPVDLLAKSIHSEQP